MAKLIILDRHGQKLEQYQLRDNGIIPRVGEMLALLYKNGTGEYLVYKVEQVVHVIEENAIIIGVGDFKITPKIIVD